VTAEFGEGLDDRIRSQMEALRVPGCALALIENRRLADVRVHGLANRETAEAVTEETLFSLQSISKPFAAWAVMKLVEAGRVDLDAPVGRYLRRWSPPPSEDYDLDLVTPRRLLSHHAGITERGFHGVEPDKPPHTVIDALRGELPPPTLEFVRHYEYWKLELDEPAWVAHPPGEAWLYSNPGFAMLEVMIEDVTGDDYAEFVTREILRPLGMARATYAPPSGPGAAVPHGGTGERCIDYRWPCRAAAGLYADILDLATFAMAGMTGPAGEPPGRGVVTPASIASMHSSHGLADQSGDVQFEAGLGHLLLTTDGPLNVHHSGGTIGWRSIFSIFPATGDGICMLMNGEAANDLWVPIVREWRSAVS